jgi:hypothetical protein
MARSERDLGALTACSALDEVVGVVGTVILT